VDKPLGRGILDMRFINREIPDAEGTPGLRFDGARLMAPGAA